ncbi:MAG: TonB-dependent receptor [Pseudohongiellaceae bacterium]|nr:TonB-dependent receptor [Pseudohongiellaceae bacterium]
MNHSTLGRSGLLLSALSLSLISIQALAQSEGENPTLLSEVVVTSSRIPTPLRNIGTSVSIIDRDEILTNGSNALIDVLRNQASISASSNGGAGQTSYIRIRGEEGFRTLTLLDGLKLSDPSGTQIQPQLEHLLSSGIGRVEILRGPQGLHYGADAGGIINISSIRGSQELSGSSDILTGDNGTDLVSAHLSGGNDNADFYLSASNYQTDGINSRSSDTILRDDDDYRNTTVHGKFGLNLTDALRLDLVVRNVESDTQYDACYHSVSGTVHDCESPYEQNAARVALSYNAAYGSHSIAYSQTETDRSYYSLDELGFSSNGELRRLEYIGTVTSMENLEIVYGIDFEQNDNGQSRDNTGYYLEYLSDFSDSFFVTAGARYDDNEEFGGHTSYRISSAYLIDLRDGATVKFRGSYGTGFRAPSLYEEQYNAGPFAFAPASTTTLSEEISKGYEAAIEYYGANSLRLELAYFDQKVKDAIDFDLVNYSGYIQDFGESQSKGVELSGEIALATQWTLLGNYTYNDTERPSGLQRLRRPEHLSNIGVRWHSSDERIKISAHYRRSENSIDENFGTIIELSDYEVLDVGLRYALSPQVELYGRVDNLLDEEYQEVFGYNSIARAAYIGVRLNF